MARGLRDGVTPVGPSFLKCPQRRIEAPWSSRGTASETIGDDSKTL